MKHTQPLTPAVPYARVQLATCRAISHRRARNTIRLAPTQLDKVKNLHSTDTIDTET